jgi:hypothetical protein
MGWVPFNSIVAKTFEKTPTLGRESIVGNVLYVWMDIK